MRILLSILSSLIFVLYLSIFTYDPPEGYSRKHHTYEELLEFARSIDPECVVLAEYSDSIIEISRCSLREYPAIINGIECHVSSVGDPVFNSGYLAGEFARQYYVMDTDYDYLVLQQIIFEKQPDWILSENRYNLDSLSVDISTGKTEQLSDEELDIVWQQAKEIYVLYSDYPVRKSIIFGLPAPAAYYNYGEQKEFIKRNSYDYFMSFTENDKQEFINRYRESWALLESGLPVYD